MSDEASTNEATDEAIEDEVLEALTADGPMSDNQKMKGLVYLLGLLEGVHDNLDRFRENPPEHPNPRSPFDHNVEQAQIALENASFRVHQITTHVRRRMVAETEVHDG